MDKVACDAQVNAKLLVAFTAGKERYGVALGYFYHVFRALETHCTECRSTPGVWSSSIFSAVGCLPDSIGQSCNLR